MPLLSAQEASDWRRVSAMLGYTQNDYHYRLEKPDKNK